MRLSKEYVELLESKGVPLSMLGIRDIALKRGDALLAVELLHVAKISVLGGDVYFRRGARIEPAYANWYIDPKEEEDQNSYLLRSWHTTERYIKQFPENKEAEPLFVLIAGR